MGQRILTDSYGNRWDVADGDDGETLRFTSPRGPEYEVPDKRRVDELKDAELIQLLDSARVRAGDEPVGEGGEGGAPGGGY